MEKTCHFLIEDEDAYLKYTKIWIKNKKLLSVKLHSEPIYGDKYIKTKVKSLNSMINTLFSGNEIPKERNHYICITAICINSVLRIYKKTYPQVYLEQSKYKTKNVKLINFIDDNFISDDLDK